MERTSGQGIHGRCRQPGYRRIARCRRSSHQHPSSIGCPRCDLCRRGVVGDTPGRQLQADRKTNLPNVAAPLPLRSSWLAGNHRGNPILDSHRHRGGFGSRVLLWGLSSTRGDSVSRLLVLGAGVSGLAAGRLARREGASVTIYDEKPSSEALGEGFAIANGSWDPVLLNGIDVVVASPGFSERSMPIVEALEWGIPVWSEIEYAWRHLQLPVIAVTGTNGKTSVTEATAAMLEASGLNAPATGNIGAPLSDFTDDGYDALVVEVSSFQLRFTETFHPLAAAITNVAADHLDWHGSEYGYRSSKARIYANQTSNDLLVYDCDDGGATELAMAASSETYPISGRRLPSGGGGVDEGSLVVGDVVIDISELTSQDTSHLANIASAAALALRVGATEEAVVKGATGYSPGPHRRSLVHEGNGIRWIDDSKATNPHAALSSIRAHDSVILIAGGLPKGLDLTPIAAEPNVRILIGIGEAGPGLAASAGERGRLAGTLDNAVEMAAQAAEDGDTVLLAPGCASFDQFDSYAARGDRFAELVTQRMEDPPR
ncbi:MAG: UDP-N-acetylmuramoyl-L-alanine--D-glutamate ligase [Acidobacteria bacterium]|nr:MAG: UDP-N-acetylmuramoyl-L-alanine--D-glutamate ligase [Acidobacteriota bacterium]